MAAAAGNRLRLAAVLRVVDVLAAGRDGVGSSALEGDDAFGRKHLANGAGGLIVVEGRHVAEAIAVSCQEAGAAPVLGVCKRGKRQGALNASIVASL